MPASRISRAVLPADARKRPQNGHVRIPPAASSSRAKACSGQRACLAFPEPSSALQSPQGLEASLPLPGVSAGGTGFGGSAPVPQLGAASPGSRPCWLSLRCGARPERLSRRPGPPEHEHPSTKLPSARRRGSSAARPAPWQGRARPRVLASDLPLIRCSLQGLSWLATLGRTQTTPVSPRKKCEQGSGRWEQELIRAVGDVHTAPWPASGSVRA